MQIYTQLHKIYVHVSMQFWVFLRHGSPTELSAQRDKGSTAFPGCFHVSMLVLSYKTLYMVLALLEFRRAVLLDVLCYFNYPCCFKLIVL